MIKRQNISIVKMEFQKETNLIQSILKKIYLKGNLSITPWRVRQGIAITGVSMLLNNSYQVVQVLMVINFFFILKLWCFIKYLSEEKQKNNNIISIHKYLDQRRIRRKSELHSNDISRTRMFTDDGKKSSNRKRKEIGSKQDDVVYIN